MHSARHREKCRDPFSTYPSTAPRVRRREPLSGHPWTTDCRQFSSESIIVLVRGSYYLHGKPSAQREPASLNHRSRPCPQNRISV